MRKNTLVAGLAIAAILMLVGAGAVRCVASSIANGQEEGETPATNQSREEGASYGSGAYDSLANAVWVAADGSGATCEFKEGMMVEKGSRLEATPLTVISEQSAKGQTVITIEPVKNGATAPQTALIVSGLDGAREVASDAFAISKSYVERVGGGGKFNVYGASKEYLELAGTTEEFLSDAISAYCEKRVPSATAATFDGEVFLDMKSGLCSATFHANDAASTIITVTAKSGALTVAG